MKSYLLSYNPNTILQQDLLAYLDTRNEILNWYVPYLGAAVIVSRFNSTYLTNLLSQKYGTAHYFIITETNSAITNGMLPTNKWDFIINPKSSGRWESALPQTHLTNLFGPNKK